MDENNCYMDVDRSLAGRIVNYLLKRPGAQDTVEGIAQWWLEIEYVEETVEKVDHALSWLCVQGVVVEERRKGISTYKLNASSESKLSSLRSQLE